MLYIRMFFIMALSLFTSRVILKALGGFVFDDPRVCMPGHHLYHLDDLCAYLRDVNLDNDVHKHGCQYVLSESIYNSEHYCEDSVRVLNL